MEELVDRVRHALAAEYAGAPNGRVRDVPDRRAIRWYTTIGLVDRPLGMQGRTAVYGPRHLLQVVAVKRRQAQGHALAAIQAELTGASDNDLAGIARVRAELLADDSSEMEADPGPVRTRFWAQTPARPTGDSPSSPASTGATEVGGIALGGGAILVLPVRPAGIDFIQLTSAARPLLTFLVEHGLLHNVPLPPHDGEMPHDGEVLTTDDRSAS